MRIASVLVIGLLVSLCCGRGAPAQSLRFLEMKQDNPSLIITPDADEERPVINSAYPTETISSIYGTDLDEEDTDDGFTVVPATQASADRAN